MTFSTAAENPKSRVKQLLLCTDLDRTLLPNGSQPESAHARRLFADFAQLPCVTLVYVSGRDVRLVEEAVRQYGIPRPNYLIGDVGASVYRRSGSSYQHIETWLAHIGQDWHDLQPENLHTLLTSIGAITQQEPEKQARYKLSYYVPASTSIEGVGCEIQDILASAGVPAKVISSRDENGVGLIDILPSRADKYQAIVFLAEQLEFPREDVIFAGDSGNDLEVLASDLKAVLVANSDDEIKKQALALVTTRGYLDTLYIAAGSAPGQNGNYSDGILEGVLHFKPEFGPDIGELRAQLLPADSPVLHRKKEGMGT